MGDLLSFMHSKQPGIGNNERKDLLKREICHNPAHGVNDSMIVSLHMWQAVEPKSSSQLLREDDFPRV